MILKQRLVCILSLAFWATLSAQDLPDSVFARANHLYEHKQYAEAFDLYVSLKTDYPENTILDFNLGNCAFRLKRYGYAIYYFEKAIQKNPDDADIRHNLELTQLYLKDKISSPPEPAIFSMFRSVLFFFTATESAITLVVLFYGLTGIFLARKFIFHPASSYWRWMQYFLGLLCVLVVMILFFRFISQKSNPEAIVLTPSIDVKNDPLPEGSPAFILHEGAKVEIKSEKGDWFEIRLPDGKIGWLKRADVGIL